MAFCTQCGKELDGPFCRHCGPGAPPPRRRRSPIVWVLIVLLVFFGIGVLGVIGTGVWFWQRARQAGVDAELFHSNPGLAVGRMVAAAHPDLEVLAADGDAVTLRNRRTGKRFRMSVSAARSGNFRLEAEDDHGAASVEVGPDAHVPMWVPQYPGAIADPVFSARGGTDREGGEAGEFTFETGDSPSDVLAYYERKAREFGMEMRVAQAGDTFTLASDADRDRVLKVVAVAAGGRTKVTVSYARRR